MFFLLPLAAAAALSTAEAITLGAVGALTVGCTAKGLADSRKAKSIRQTAECEREKEEENLEEEKKRFEKIKRDFERMKKECSDPTLAESLDILLNHSNDF